jgi:hypothetical protein
MNTPSKNDILELLNRKKNLFLFSSFLSDDQIIEIKNEIEKLIPLLEKYTLNLIDGSFLPLPYSTIRSDQQTQENTFDTYIESKIAFNNTIQHKNLKTIQLFIEKIKQIFDAEILEIDGKELLPLGIRILNTNQLGIDIHCENAFLNQLDANFRKKMYEKIDLENAISLYLTIQEAEDGGELLLFGHEWETVKFELNKTSYEERHDIGGSIFTNRGYDKPKVSIHKFSNGDLTTFRAAQIWHSINKIDGNKKRITMGCFIARGKDNKCYLWA